MQDTLFKNVLTSIISISDSDIERMLNLFETKPLKKNEFLLKEGQVCNFVAFINKGTLIYTRLHDSGQEITTDFAFAGDLVADNHSRISNSPSILNIKAIADAELLLISSANLEKCYCSIPQTERLGRILIEKAFVKIVRQNIDFQTLTASERYQKMLQEYPDVFQKIPLQYIANYLGISPKSLSRIRKEINS